MATKKDSSAHLRVHPSRDHKTDLEGNKLFNYKDWKAVRDYHRPTSFNYTPQHHGIAIYDIVKVGNVYKQRFTRNNMIAGVPLNEAYSTFYVFVNTFDFLTINQLLDRQDEWIKTDWNWHMKDFKKRKMYSA